MASAQEAQVDADGYRSQSFPGGHAPTYVYVSVTTPFMAVVKRVRKALENRPQKTNGLPLTVRVAALSTGREHGPGGDDDDEDDDGAGAGRGGDGAEVVVLGTGRAIEKTLNVAAWFNRQKDYRVSLRTRTLGAVDDVVMPETKNGEEDNGEGGVDQARVRMVSCLEAVVTLR